MLRTVFPCFLFLIVPAILGAQSGGVLKGKVVLDPSGEAVHSATVMIVQLGRSVQTDTEGAYQFNDVPPGTYDVLAHLHPLGDQRQRVTITSGAVAAVNFKLRLAAVHEQITVTASGREETALEAFQTVTSMQTLELTAKSAPSLGEVLENEPGVAKRSSGPGTTRPVIRGFDGDRVLVLQDGMPTGTLGYQSGDHGEPVDVTSLERVEVVRGPATLLYGSNAIGGVVNAVTSHHQVHQHPHPGLRGHLTGMGGSNNGLAGGSGGFEYGYRNWLLWGGGGRQRTGDYHAPLGKIENSQTDNSQASVGLGHYGSKYFASLGYGFQEGTYGIPAGVEDLLHSEEGHDEHELVDLKFQRHNVRTGMGVKDFWSMERFALTLDYTDWHHREMSLGEVHNRFYNKQFSYRGVFDQKKRGHNSGNFGFMGRYRDYKAIGEEAFAPPVTQTAFAAFALEQFSFEKFRIQLGGRIENTGYTPSGLRDRSFTGVSGAAGIQVPLWRGGSFVTNYTHSYRAPALEELYSYGPHAGNLTFEIGDANLRREAAEGLDVSLRHEHSRIKGEVNFFQYWIGDYVYLAPTGGIQDGLIEALYRQGDAHYQGIEGRIDAGICPNLWLNLGVDAVRATLTSTDMPLPRIPPLRGRIGMDVRYKGLSIRPGLLLTNQQDRIFPTETATAGYGVIDLAASYVYTQKHAMHVFGVDTFNLGNNLYRNHLSFIKEIAPEIGRGIRAYYTIQFF
ncbi:MAG TPA: TonB-dependent receptor [Bryobacteraceae bacterium]|nr:TonB-dependent receptor [Bryobacteraceae bacterium]